MARECRQAGRRQAREYGNRNNGSCKGPFYDVFRRLTLRPGEKLAKITGGDLLTWKPIW